MENKIVKVDAEVIEAEAIEPSDELRVTYTPAVLSDNIAALDAYIEYQIAPYVGAVIDPNDNQQVKDARTCMADLNKLKEPIEKERKRIKRIYEAPLKKFEAKVKTITSKIDETRANLKTQVDEADARFKSERRELLETEYVGCAGVISDVIPFSAVLDDKWLNRSTMESKAINELYEKVETALKGYKTLQTKELNHKDEVVKHYADTLDLIGALELEDKLNERDREMEAFKEAERAAQLVAESRNAPKPEPEPESTAEPMTSASPQVFRYSLSMEFEGTREFAKKVANALKSVGITGATIKAVEEVRND